MKSKVVYKTDVYKADAEKAGTDRGSKGLGQGNFELVANFGYIHEGRLTLAKACVSAGSQSLP